MNGGWAPLTREWADTPFGGKSRRRFGCCLSRCPHRAEALLEAVGDERGELKKMESSGYSDGATDDCEKFNQLVDGSVRERKQMSEEQFRITGAREYWTRGGDKATVTTVK